MTYDWQCPKCGTINPEDREGCLGGDFQLPLIARQHLDLAYIYDEKGEFEQALCECELAIHLAPHWAEAHNLRGVMLDELGRQSEAVGAFRQAVRLDPKYRDAKENLREAEAELKGQAGSLEIEVTPPAEPQLSLAVNTLAPEMARLPLKVAHKMKRPKKVTMICCFYWLNTLTLTAVGVISPLLILGPYLSSVLPLSRISEEIAGILVVLGLAGVAIVLAIFFAVVGWGLWRLRPWARRAAMIGSSLAIAFNVITLLAGFGLGRPSIPYGIVFHGLTLFILTDLNVRAAFEPVPVE